MIEKRQTIKNKDLIEMTDSETGNNFCIEVKTLIKLIKDSIPPAEWADRSAKQSGRAGKLEKSSAKHKK